MVGRLIRVVLVAAVLAIMSGAAAGATWGNTSTSAYGGGNEGGPPFAWDRALVVGCLVGASTLAVGWYLARRRSVE
jgi:hypothetical protein